MTCGDGPESAYLKTGQWQGLRDTCATYAKDHLNGFVSRFELACGVTADKGVSDVVRAMDIEILGS